MMIVGLTGGIGSGKTAASDYFEQLGVPVIDADVIARELVQPGQPALNEIIQHLGQHYLTSEGQLNRVLLREHMVNDVQLKQKLEKILHPLIQSEIKRQIKAINSDYCIIVVPLLIENIKNYSWLDRILVMDVPLEVQLERLSHRVNLTKDSALKLIQLQTSRSSRLSHADDILDNSSSIEQLKAQIDALHQQYIELSHQS